MTEITDGGIERLANAIIMQACEDYATEYRKYLRLVKKRGKNSVEVEKQYGYVIAMAAWFDSRWYHRLTDLDGKYLLERLRNKIQNY